MAEKLPLIMGNPTLSSSARVAYYWLRLTAKRDGCSYETNASLGEVVGVNISTVSLIAKELSDANLVRREGCGRGTKTSGRKRWALLGLSLALFASAPEPASSQPIPDLFASQSNLHFPDTDDGEEAASTVAPLASDAPLSLDITEERDRGSRW